MSNTSRVSLSWDTLGASFEKRIGSKVVIREDGCWIYGKGDADTYGVVTTSVDGKVYREQAHRVFFETLVGEIPDGYDVHHQCEVKRCVNPKHLVAMDPRIHPTIHAVERGSFTVSAWDDPSKFSAQIVHAPECLVGTYGVTHWPDND